MGDSRYKDNLTTLAKRLRPLMLAVAESADGTALNANEWGKIIRVGTATADVQIYEPTEAGVTAALGDCSSGHNLYFPRSITIAMTARITAPNGVGLIAVNLSFSGFGGAAITLGDSCSMSGYAVMDGTGEATAFCVQALGVSLTGVSGHFTAKNATQNRGLNGSGTGQYDGLTFSGTFQAQGGTDCWGIYIQEYCYSLQASGQARDGSNSNYGVVLAGSVSTDESHYPHMMDCWGFGLDAEGTGLVVADGKYGSVFNSHFYGESEDVLVGTGSTLIVADSSWDSETNNGTITPMAGDRSAVDVNANDILHANDIADAKFLRHTPDVGNAGNIIYDDGDEWVSDTPANAGIVGTDEKAGVSANDTTPGYLNGKLVAGDNITLTEGADGGDETLTIAAAGTSASDAYWEPAVDADGDDIMFTDDGDIAMIWVE